LLARKNVRNTGSHDYQLEILLPSKPPQDSEPHGIGADVLEGDALRDFNRVLASVIEETISGLLGKQVVQPLYDHLTNHHSIPKDALPSHLTTLHEVLRYTIGLVATGTVERAIARTLCVRLRIPFNSSSDLTLLEYVEEAKRNLAEQLRSR